MTTALAEKTTAKAGQRGTVLLGITCIGISPLLMNPMTPETLGGIIDGVRPQIKRDRPFEEVAAEKIYRNDDGQMCIPTMNLIAALNHAGRSVKMGKKGISTATSTTLFSFLEIPGEYIPFNDLDTHGALPWRVDMRRGVMNNAGKSVAVGIIRPKFPEWSFTVMVKLNEALIGQDTLRKLFDEAGTNAGLGDFRPQRKGPFGRFRVAEWKVLD